MHVCVCVSVRSRRQREIWKTGDDGHDTEDQIDQHEEGERRLEPGNDG